jgi:hypothetical protein
MPWVALPVVVAGKSFLLGQVYGGVFFHGSIHRIAVGTNLLGGCGAPNFEQSSLTEVSISSDRGRAMHWAREARAQRRVQGPIFLYTVEPLGTISLWRAGLDQSGNSFVGWEARAREVRVLSVEEFP